MKPPKRPTLPTPRPSAADAAQADPSLPLVDSGAPERSVFASMVKVAMKSPKKRMGRPPANGMRSPLILLRTLSILKHFEEARRTLGHTASIAATVKAVRAEFASSGVTDAKPLAWKKAGLKWNSPPADVQRVNAPIARMNGVSATEVKRVLTTLQPAGGALVFRVRPHGNGGALYVGSRPVKRTYLG